MNAYFNQPPNTEALVKSVVRKYKFQLQSGWQLTMTSVTRDLILKGADNDYIRAVVLELFGQYRDNRQINRVRKNTSTKGC
mgnify:CR=1 FL=1